jgi:lipopolysaccharide biosynthesis regulator YciM
MRVGDLQLKRGQADKAIESYAQVAEIFSASGFDAKAVAIYKQILRIDPAQLEAHTRLGDLYRTSGSASSPRRCASSRRRPRSSRAGASSARPSTS